MSKIAFTRERERESKSSLLKNRKDGVIFYVLLSFLPVLILTVIVSKVLAATNSWDFSTSTDYTFDNTKIEFVSGQAQLKATTTPAWYNISWTKRKPITITGSTAGAQTNYQVKVTVPFVSGMQANYNDIRFTSSDGTTLVSYWLESKTDSTTADFWVQVPSIPASPATTLVYMYYGNSGATSASNGANTFISGTDFVQDDGFTFRDNGANESYGNNTGFVRSANSELSLVNIDRNSDSYVGKKFVPSVIVNSVADNTYIHEPEESLIDGNYIYVATRSGAMLSVYDISSPTAPVFVSNFTDIDLTQAMGIAKNGNTIYLSSFHNHKLLIIDASNPAALTKLSSITLGGATLDPGNPDELRKIFYSNGYVYAARSDEGTLYIVDVSNPLSPSITGSLSGLDGIFCSIVKGNFVFVGGYLNDPKYLKVVDVSDKAHPSVVKTLTDTVNYHGTSGFAISGNYLYADYYLSGTFVVFDITDPPNTFQKGILSGALNSPSHFDLFGGMAYIPSANGIAMIDVTDQTHPVLSYYEDSAMLTKAYDAKYHGGYVYAVGRDVNSLVVISPSAPLGSMNTNFALRSRFKVTAATAAAWIPVGGLSEDNSPISATTTSYSLTPIWYNNTLHLVEMFGAGSTYYTEASSSVNTVLGTTYITELTKIGNSATLNIYQTNGTLVGTSTINSVTNPYVYYHWLMLFQNVGAKWGATGKTSSQEVFYSFIRKFASPEPTYNIGTESTEYDVTNPTIRPVSATIFTSLSGFSETSTVNGGAIKYQISNDGGSTWYWYNSGWVSSDGTYTQANSSSTINSNIATFPVGSGQFLFKAFLHSDGTQLVQLDNISLTYTSVTAPTLTTSAPTSVSTSTMTLNGSITADGNASSTARGFAWGTNSNLSGGDTATTTETPGPFGVGSFTKALTGLTASTTYYFRAYAVNSAGTSTGSILSTSTLQWSVPGAPTGVTATAGNAQASVTFSTPASTGGSTITGYTVISNPAGGTDTNAGTTALTHTVTGLTNGTPYTFTVTATNIIGTSSASSASSPVTPITVSSITTVAASNTSTSTVTMNANVSSIGGSSITQHGFAYGTVSNLSTVIATTSLGSVGTGDFSQSLTGLTPNTTYYFRAYAVNSAGTSTGLILSFATTDITPPTVNMTAPTVGATVNGSSVTLTSTATDDVGVLGVQFMLDGTSNIGSEITATSSPNTYTTTWNSTAISTYSSHTIYAVARDAAGNHSTSTVTVNVDNVAPTLVSAVYDSDTQITVTLSKLANAGTITKANDGGFTVAKTGVPGTTFAVSSIAPGTDNTKVVLTVASMTSVGGVGVKVTYSHTGNGTVADTLGNLLATDSTGITIPPWNTVAPIISSITSTVSNGSYKLGSAIDINLTFSKAVTSTGSVTVTFNTGGTCSFTVSNSTTASCTYTVGSSENANPLNVSSIVGTITSTDSNVMTSFTPALNLSADKTIIVDTTVPTVSVTVPSNTATVAGTSVTLTATNSDGGSGIAGVQFVLDGTTNIGSSGATNPYSVTWNSNAVSNASHTISAVARDAADNRATSTITVTVDNNSYTVGGTISGQSDAVILQDNGGDNKSVASSSSSFTFATGLLYGTTYNVTVLTQPSGQTCSVSNGSGTMTSSNVTNVSVTCTNNPIVPTPTPTVTASVSSSGGGSASSQVNNLIAMGNYTLAQQIAKQFGILIPIQKLPVQNISANTPPIPTSNGGQSFTRTLKVGVISNDVKRLQIFLNAQGFVVAKKGAGSPGHETTTFGPATKAALMKFQLAHKKETLDPQGLKTPTGFFGMDTMKAVNKLMKSQ